MERMSLEEAKCFFFSMNCSTFVMARENKTKYESYLALNISKETENLWRIEQLNKCYIEIKQYNGTGELWLFYNKMYELTESIKSSTSLTIMEDALKYMISKLEIKERIIVAEIINGRNHRSVRSGLIYLSFDLGDKVKAKSFANLSLDLLNISSDDEYVLVRARHAKMVCNEIINELGI